LEVIVHFGLFGNRLYRAATSQLPLVAQSTHNPDYQKLLAVLRAARERVGVTQLELAERLGTTQTFVSKCERGERRIDAVELIEFAEALGVPPLELISAYLHQRRRGVLPTDRKAPRSR
jgi:transcriptional regulator with XRE-family HTH domain